MVRLEYMNGLLSCFFLSRISTATSLVTPKEIDDTTRFLQQSNVTSDIRSVLVIRILEDESEIGDTTMIETQLNTILFTGNSTYMVTKAPNGITLNTTGTSVSQQLYKCSMGQVTLTPLSHANSHIWNIIVDASKIDNRNERTQWISAAAKVAYTSGYITSSNSDSSSEIDRTGDLRKIAQHVILILPPKYPNENGDFLASAEVNSTISVFLSTMTNSLSMYLHELGHNLQLQHAGGLDPSQVYGDKTGYMGTSEVSPYFPLKCYNAANNWIMNWYAPYRISLLQHFYSKSKWSGRLQVNAFVDSDKLDDMTDNAIVLVQIDDYTYLQFNRAKSYNIGTPMMIDEVVIIRDLTSNTQLMKGMNMTNYHDTATYRYKSVVINPKTNATIKKDVMIQLCDIVLHNATANTKDYSSAVDYAIIAVGLNVDDDSLCRSGFVTGATYTGNGPVYLTNSTKGNGPNIDFDGIFKTLSEMNVLLLIFIGCMIVLLIGWIIKLLCRCIVYYCCCGCKCICSDDAQDTKTEAMNEQQQVIIPYDLPKEPKVPKRRGMLTRFFQGRRKNSQQDTESTETSQSHTSALPVATAVQLY
jgi:hypothetical protein